MAGSTILDANLLAVAGVSGALATLLTGLTVVAAREKIEAIMAAKIAGSVAGRGDRTGYSVDGQSLTFNTADLETARALLVRLSRSYGGGGTAIPVAFA